MIGYLERELEGGDECLDSEDQATAVSHEAWLSS